MRKRTPISEFVAQTSQVSEIDWARLAAFLDGEGTIFIQRNSHSRGHVLTVIVANTDTRLIRWLQDTFSGYVYFSHSRSQRSYNSNNICYSWRVLEERAELVLVKILPYLILKKEQAEVGLAYRALKKTGVQGRKITDEVQQSREAMRDKIIALNRSIVHKVQKIS